jgi:predicted Zn-dependent protease
MLNKVRQLEKEKRYQEAEIILLELLSHSPDNLYYKKYVAELRLKSGRFREAEELIDDVLTQVPTDPFALSLKGEALMKRNRWGEAYDYFQSSYKVSPSAYVASQMIDAKVKSSSAQETLELAKNLVKEYPDDKWLKKRLARVQELSGNKEEALSVYQELRGTDPEDEYVLAAIMRLKAETSGKGGPKDLERVLKLDKYRENVPMLLSTAKMHFQSKDYDKAVEYYHQAYALKPDDNYIVRQLGFCYNKLRKYEEAAHYFKMAMKADPMNIYVRSTILSVYKKMGKEEELIQFLNELLIEYPDFKEAYGMMKRLSTKEEKN